MLRPGTFVAILATVLATGAGALRAAEGERAPLSVTLEPAELPLSSFKSLLGQYVRSSPDTAKPEGYDSLFQTELGGDGNGKGVSVRLLHTGWNENALKLFQLGKDGKAEEIPRHESRIYSYYVAFGPIRVEGLPPFTAHMYFRASRAKSMKTRPRLLYLTPMQCMAGEVLMGDKPVRIALLDTNFNGTFTDPCVAHARSGDWVLFDGNGDGKFEIRYSGSESMGLTKYVKLNESTWAIDLKGEVLTLTPARPESYRIRFDGAGKSCTVYAWSAATGTIRASLDASGSMEVPRGKITLYSYQSLRGDWRINGSLRVLGALSPPPEDELVIKVGPKLKIRLDHAPQGENHRFTFRCLGRAGETVSLYIGKLRAPAPTLVVRDAEGNEVVRAAMRYG